MVKRHVASKTVPKINSCPLLMSFDAYNVLLTWRYDIQHRLLYVKLGTKLPDYLNGTSEFVNPRLVMFTEAKTR